VATFIAGGGVDGGGVQYGVCHAEGEEGGRYAGGTERGEGVVRS
jgi:hypothetical protein